MLGRLNGKSEGKLQKEQDSRDDLKRTTYTERRWGSVRFVRGGLLVGEKSRTPEDSNGASHTNPLSDAKPQQPPSQTVLQSLQYNPEESYSRDVGLTVEPLVAGEMSVQKKKKKKKKKSKSRLDVSASNKLGLDANKERTQFQTRVPASVSSTPTLDQSKPEGAPYSEGSVTQQGLGKMEEKISKAERRALRYTKRQKEQESETLYSATSCSTSSGTREIVVEVAENPTATSRHDLGCATIVPVQGSAAMFSGGRHAVRRRYIQQKRLAVNDLKALNEVCANFSDIVNSLTQFL